jgi:hypothetical protein
MGAVGLRGEGSIVVSIVDRWLGGGAATSATSATFEHSELVAPVDLSTDGHEVAKVAEVAAPLPPQKHASGPKRRRQSQEQIREERWRHRARIRLWRPVPAARSCSISCSEIVAGGAGVVSGSPPGRGCAGSCWVRCLPGSCSRSGRHTPALWSLRYAPGVNPNDC